MTTLAVPLPAPPSAPPRPLRWTCAEFHRIGEAGAFEGKRAMLIHGVILEQGPMNPPHAITLGLVEQALRQAFGSTFWLRNQSPLVLGQNTDPEPDLAVVPGSPRDYSAHPTTANLVVEVSDTTLDFDMNEKRQLYAKANIPEYWVVDVNSRTLRVYRDPKAGDYQTQQSLAESEKIQPLSATQSVSVADLFR